MNPQWRELVKTLGGNKCRQKLTLGWKGKYNKKSVITQYERRTRIIGI